MLIKSLTHGPGLPPAWANDLKTSNGMLAEVNSHDLDCVRWLIGSDIERIYVETANFKGAERA
jgi:predicted dehydrogenase